MRLICIQFFLRLWKLSFSFFFCYWSTVDLQSRVSFKEVNFSISFLLVPFMQVTSLGRWRDEGDITVSLQKAGERRNFLAQNYHSSSWSRESAETKPQTFTEIIHENLPRVGFLNLGMIATWGWRILCCGGLFCALQDVYQDPWLLPTKYQ